MLADIDSVTFLTLGTVAWVLIGSLVAALMVAISRKNERQKKLNQQMAGYSLTPRAAEYRLLWSKRTLERIDARCEAIAKKENIDIIDVQIIKQAILEVAHNEWVRLSNRR